MSSPLEAPEKQIAEETSAKPAPQASVIDTSKMSAGKAAALDLAESSRDPLDERGSFASNLFIGRYDFNRIYAWPEQSAEDRAAGAEFLESLKKYLHDHVDADEIDRTGEIPQKNIDDLFAMGAFAVKIPKQYGGLGLSQVNYGRAAMLLGSWDANLTALVSAHQSIGVPQPLLLFGTEEQKQKYLPRVARQEISAFALTESHAGSDPATMSLRADPTPDGSAFILNGEKLWCTNGLKAGVLVVMAKTAPKIVNGKERKQITAFIVDVDTPGLEMPHRCHFMGLRALYNGVVTFKDVRVPRENIIAGEGKGLKVALTTLNTGRLTIPAACVGLSKRLLEICRKWAAERVQWGVPIGQHYAIAGKVAEMAGNIFAMEAMTFLTSALVDRKAGDLRIETAMCKMWATETTWRIADDAMQVRGGRGYETAESLRGTRRGADRGGAFPARLPDQYYLRRIERDHASFHCARGARSALESRRRDFQYAVADVDTRESDLHLRKILRLLVSEAVAWWCAGEIKGLHSDLRAHANYGARTSRRLARGLFHAMTRFGPKLDREQLLLSRFVGIATELFAISATCSFAQHKINQGEPAAEVFSIANYFCRSAKMRIDHHFAGTTQNADRVVTI